MLPSIKNEIVFKTSRSGGPGGQNVNKVETAVEGYWLYAESTLFTAEQKNILAEKLKSRITKSNEIIVKSQVHRTQLANKEEVVEKFNTFIVRALEKKQARIATKPGKMAKESRLQNKKLKSEKKQNRQAKWSNE